MNYVSIFFYSFTYLLLVSCSQVQVNNQELKQKETTKINSFFEQIFEEEIQRYPTAQTYLGRKTSYGLLDDETEAQALREFKIAKENLQKLREFDFKLLDEESKLSYRILEDQLKRQIEGFKWRYHSFPINQMFGYQSESPSFLINMHQIENVADAKAYISRLKEIKRVFDERLQFLKKQEKLGIIPPAFVFPKVLEDAINIISGAPFDEKKSSPLYLDFGEKIEKLNLSEDEKEKLLKEARLALKNYVLPAYQDLIQYVTYLSDNYKSNNGVWALPEGEAFYNYRLESATTTDLSAEEIHEIGLKEVERIQKEMRSIMRQVGFKGSLQDFFTHMRSDKYFFSNTSKGRKIYLSQVNEVINKIKPALPLIFNTFPKAKLEVKPVEAFREKSAGTAFYSGPSMEGNRPGIYYVNLYKMADNPSYRLEALTYHETIPGHHMQIAIANELEELPKFRRSGGFTAYTEGWGLYAELLPKEIGFYKNPYSDFGRLSMEIWRAVRLVVDTGIHAKRWSREKAMEYMRENSPAAELETEKEIERYFVMPGQATAYKIGMMKILELREKARKELGNKFDIKKFHAEVLEDGALPLQILEENIKLWIQKSKDSDGP